MFSGKRAFKNPKSNNFKFPFFRIIIESVVNIEKLIFFISISLIKFEENF
jgi:hypothetical protein